MKKASDRVARASLFVLLTVTALFSLGRILTKPKSGIDFFSLIWYPGHFLWQGADPYAAALEQRVPDLPVRYWDGVTAVEFVFPIEPMPTNPAPIVLLFSPLARLSWPVAMNVWTLINVALLPVIAWAVASLFRCNLFSRRGVLLLLILCSLIATREVIETGQTTIVTFACMMVALILAPVNQVLAGVFTGLALSKYSLTFPGVLYLLYRRQYWSVLIGLGVQVLGMFLVAAIGRVSPYHIVAEYMVLMAKHIDMPGLHLRATLLEGLGHFATLVLGLFSAGLFAVLAYWHQRARIRGVAQSEMASITILVIVMQWNLLVLPHRRYDHIAEILFLGMMLLWVWKNPQRLDLYRYQYWGLLAFWGGAFVVWSLPLYYVLGATFYKGLFSSLSLGALACSVWLLFRATSQVEEPDHQRMG